MLTTGALNPENTDKEKALAQVDPWDELFQASMKDDADFNRWFDANCGTIYFPTAGPAFQAQRVAAYRGWLAGYVQAVKNHDRAVGIRHGDEDEESIAAYEASEK